MSRRAYKPESILLKHIEHLRELRNHLEMVRKDMLVVKGQEPKTLLSIERARENILKQIEKMTEPIVVNASDPFKTV